MVLTVPESCNLSEQSWREILNITEFKTGHSRRHRRRSLASASATAKTLALALANDRLRDNFFGQIYFNYLFKLLNRQKLFSIY